MNFINYIKMVMSFFVFFEPLSSSDKIINKTMGKYVFSDITS